jgi:hypothetical protein
MKKKLFILLLAFGVLYLGADQAFSWTSKPVSKDPLVRMPGTQPGQITLEGPGRCLNCHADYNHSVEPGFNWKGSMMAQASRDFIYWTCQTVSAQDAIWAVGNPNATDICARCHFPIGWLEGRSDPTNNSLMRGDDYDGVNCDFCHTLYNPFFEDADKGVQGGSDWADYWDEASSLSSDEAAATYDEDITIAQGILLFNGNPMFGAGNQPVTKASGYDINAGGQYFNSPNSQKRSSFADPNARHQILYSRYHQSKYFCSTCHDISNPILHNLTSGYGNTQPGDGTTILPTESDPSYSYFHVERTFSEFMLSDYALQGGAAGKGPFAPDSFVTSLPGNKIGKCQDCHMRDVVGVGCNKKGAPIRPDESDEHPNSGLPLHDLTGGNAWVAGILASAIPGSPNYDQVNYDLLHAPNLTVDLVSGSSNEPEAMIAGMERSKQQLELASSIDNLSYTSATGELSFQVQNNTGHKLISGFPEGRRMYVNIVATYSDGSTYEVNPYDEDGGTLIGLHYTYNGMGDLPDPLVLGANGASEVHVDELVYEAHTSSSLTGEDHTFHFALATDRYKDNRIPPKGFRIEDAESRLSEPKWHGEPDLDYFTGAEYAGGYDEVNLTIPAGATKVEVNLYYQTTSREYIEFLRNEVNGTGSLTLSSPTPSGETNAYIAQTDPFFAELKGWGNTIWGLWVHNKDKMGAAPFLMAQAVRGDTPPPACDPPAPDLLSTETASGQVTINWTDEHTADDAVLGYTVYYDQADKSQFLADIVGPDPETSFTDTGLVNGQQYCYKVTSKYETCESEFSNILCATPEAPGQVTVPAGVASIETGFYSGKGKSRTFNSLTLFAQGAEVIFRAKVLDESGAPVEGTTVDLSITGESSTNISTGTSDVAGIAEGSWKTTTRKGGTPLGTYTATTTGVTATGYEWDSVETSTTFEITE